MAANIGEGLSDEEIKRLSTLPLVIKSEVYARVEAWVAENRERLEREHPGQYLYIDAKTLHYTVGKNHNDADAKWYGPLPSGGRNMLGIQLKHPRS